MQQKLTYALMAGLVLGGIGLAHGFSLLGPLNAPGNAWQVGAIGYARPGDIGAPMNLNEEYRWNSPTITYAFDQSFLVYFGQEGVEAVEAAMRTFNNLPPVSQMSEDLSEFPMDNKKANYTAQAMGVMDLRSTTMIMLTEMMGLAEPERWTWCLRDKATYTSGGVTYTNYLVFQRNFDPITGQPTNRVNSAFYGYTIYDPVGAGAAYADAVETVLDPLTLVPYSSVAGGNLSAGYLFTGLTRDDVGGLRYCLRAQNYNVEALPPGTVVATNGSATNGLGWAMNSPWQIYLGSTNLLTNSMMTNIWALTNPPWSIYLQQSNLFSLTNLAATNAVGSNTIFQAGLRGGREKIRFVRADYDSLLGQAFQPVTNYYTDVVLSNYVRISTRVERVSPAPDILFVAMDLGVNPAPASTPVMVRRSLNFINNDAINGQTTHAGPGNLSGPVLFSFTDILPAYMNTTGGGTPGLGNATRTAVWGSFTASGEDPITIYPNWVSLQQLEQMLESQ